MKNILLSLSVLAIFASFAACKKSDNSSSSNASVMYVNGCAGAANVNVSVNSTAVGAANNLAFLKNTGYQSVKASSNIGFAYTLTATGTPLTTGTETLNAGSSYSVFASGLVTGPSFVFTNDDLTAPASGSAKVRFVNLCSDNLNVSCYIGSTKIDSNVAYKSCTPYSQVTATTSANVLLQDPANPTSLTQLSAQTFSAGKIYTVMLTGTTTGTGVSALTLTVIGNN